MSTSDSNAPDFVDVLRAERRDLLARLRATRFPVVKPGYSQAQAAPEKIIALFDTFSGVAKADSAYDTLYKGGEHADTDRDIVSRLFDELGLRCEIHAGMFPDDTLAGLPARISLAHIDVDTYLSAKESFEVIWPRVAQGGMAVFDDYGFWGCEGVTQFVNEGCARLADGVLVHNLNGHAVVVKTAKAA